jgi:hypothetical protein
MNLKRLLLAIAILICLALATTAGRAGDDEKSEKSENIFADKIVMVHLDAEMEVLAGIITNVEFKMVEGRKFLVGVGVPTKRPEDWWSGRKVFVAWDKVTGYVLLTKDEFDEYLEALKDEDRAA